MAKSVFKRDGIGYQTWRQGVLAKDLRT